MRAHGKALLNGNLDGVVSNYARDAVLVTPAGAHRGHDGVREAQTKILGDLAGARFTYETHVIEDSVVFIEWSAEGDDFVVTGGVDTIVIADGAISVQTIRYSKQDKRHERVRGSTVGAAGPGHE
jgi:hypothetical protein